MYRDLPVPGDVVDGYVIREELGRGGMGVVFAVEDPTMQRRPCAIKVLLPELAREPVSTARFVQEARAASQLVHPNIVEVWGIHAKEHSYIVMERLYGQSLAERIAVKPLSVDEAVWTLRDVLGGIKEAHRKGVTHRDLKPDNVFLCCTETGEPIGAKVLDFGISRFEGPNGRAATASGLGTPAYMAPEQIYRPELVDNRTDIYALGVVLYEALSGHQPFDGGTMGQVWSRIEKGAVPPLSARAAVPESLAAIVAKAMAREPANRYQSASEFLRVLDAWRFNEGAALVHSVRPALRPRAPWDGTYRLRPELFEFPIAQAMAVANLRRDMAGRGKIEASDLIVGLLRTGQLSHYLLSESGLEYLKVSVNLLDCSGTAASDRTLPVAPASALLGKETRGVDGISPLRRRLIDNDLAALLESLFSTAEHEPVSTALSELTVLRALVPTKPWAELAAWQSAPALPDCRRAEEILTCRDGVDDNGNLDLHGFDDAAKRVVYWSHELAARAGSPDVTEDALLASSIANSELVRSELHDAGWQPADVLRTLTQVDRPADPVRVRVIPFDAATATLLPIARRARASSGNVRPDSLFHALCRHASGALRARLAAAHPGFDLNAFLVKSLLGHQLDAEAFAVIDAARRIAAERGYQEVPNRALFVGFLSNPGGLVGRTLANMGVSVTLSSVVDRCLPRVAATSTEVPLDERSCRRAIAPVLKAAAGVATAGLAATDPINELRLFDGFVHAAPQGLLGVCGSALGLDFDTLYEACLATAWPAAGASHDAALLELPPSLDSRAFTDDGWELLQRAGRIAVHSGYDRIRSIHLFLCLLEYAYNGEDSPPEIRALTEILSQVSPAETTASSNGPLGMSDAVAALLSEAMKNARAKGERTSVAHIAALVRGAEQR